jgi:hypothetical protein
MTNDGGQKTADLNHHRAQVQPDDEGIGQFPVNEGTVSVWVRQDAI